MNVTKIPLTGTQLPA